MPIQPQQARNWWMDFIWPVTSLNSKLEIVFIDTLCVVYVIFTRSYIFDFYFSDSFSFRHFVAESMRTCLMRYWVDTWVVWLCITVLIFWPFLFLRFQLQLTRWAHMNRLVFGLLISIQNSDPECIVCRKKSTNTNFSWSDFTWLTSQRPLQIIMNLHGLLKDIFNQ